LYSNAVFTTTTSILLEEKDSGSRFRTFEDFEFRAEFTDRKNTPTFAAVMVKEIKLPVSCLKLGRKFVVILAGRDSAI
jgi:hypothetical protein